MSDCQGAPCEEADRRTNEQHDQESGTTSGPETGADRESELLLGFGRSLHVLVYLSSFHCLCFSEELRLEKEKLKQVGGKISGPESGADRDNKMF
jgi:hypothetical protein